MYKNLARRTLRLVPSARFAVARALRPALRRCEPLKVGFVYVTRSAMPAGPTSTSRAASRCSARSASGCRRRCVEAVAEGADAERVMRDLAVQGHRLIFATSFGYLEPALRVAADFPAVRFEHAGGYKTAPNLNTYNARYYEGRYLAGLLAGQREQERQSPATWRAFRCPRSSRASTRSRSACARRNPKAEVRVLWLNTWFDPAREREAALALVDQGADVLTNHSGVAGGRAGGRGAAA